MKKAFITGIGGQDGSYLAEYLLELGYEVHGIVRRNSTPEHQQSRLDNIRNHKNLHVCYGDLNDTSGIERLLRDIQPDEVYNIAAQSHVRISYEIPQFTVTTNAVGVVNILEAVRNNCPKGILFNHESPRRGSNFVTNKVVKAAVRIKLGLQNELELGNLDAYRDWGHSKDYIRAMHLILQQPEAGDWVVATGETRSVRDMCKYVFSQLDMNYEDYVVQNPKFLRPEELKYLKGDSTKIRELGWKPEYTFETMMDEMIQHWLDHFNKNK